MTWQEIPGWLSEREAQALQDEAAAVRLDAAVVALGTWHGKSLMALCAAVKPGVQIHWYDNYLPGSRASLQKDGGGDPEKARESAMAISLGDPRVHPHLTDSISGAVVYAGPPIGLIYFDGHHDRTQVLAEIAMWIPNLDWRSPVLAFHDFHGGFQMAKAIRHVLPANLWRESGPHHSMACFARL